jgi:hypothetical protein
VIPQPALRRRSTADVVATVILFLTQAVLSVLSFIAGMGPALWLMMPVCSDN